MKLLLLLSFLQSILVAFALFKLRSRWLPNRLLAFHILCWGMMCFYRFSAFQTKEFYLTYHYTLKFNLVLETLMFVFVFLYIKYLATEKSKINKYDFIHFVPAIITFILLIPFFTMPASLKVDVFLMRHSHYYQLLELILFLVSIGQGTCYFISSFKYIHQYHQRLKEHYSNTSARTIYWMQATLGIVAIMVILGFIGGILGGFLGYGKLSQYIFNILYITIGLSIYMTAFYMIIQHGLFTSSESTDVSIKTLSISDLSTNNQIPSSQSLTGSVLSQEYIDKIALELERVMSDEKLFLFSDLSLNAVALQIHIPRQHISEVLNKNLNTSFFDYVNKYRIEESKRKIKEDSLNKYTLIALGIESGFNSKASFYRNFRKYENMTPLEYKQLIDNDHGQELNKS